MRITDALGALLLGALLLGPVCLASEPTLQDGVQADWLGQVQRDLKESEYHAGPVERTPFEDLGSAL